MAELYAKLILYLSCLVIGAESGKQRGSSKHTWLSDLAVFIASYNMLFNYNT